MTELSAVQIFFDERKTVDAAFAKREIGVVVTEKTTFHINLSASKEMFDFAHNRMIVVTDADGKEHWFKIQAGKDKGWTSELHPRTNVPRLWYWPQPGKSTRKLSLDADDLNKLVKVMAELKRQFIASPPASIGNSKRLKI